ncbi:hypothetical protein BRD04_01340 [Halobacteriales archaeon QS_9_67_17]|nr:MAG: hypothetical protein BRD04_01340 [Halobacteriales archaeon QS_9_67_17]
MELIDERGRLFGRVNVVDALVVLLVVAVVAAGVALVAGGAGGGIETTAEETSRVVTVELGSHPDRVATLVEPGNVTFAGEDATITDVYRSPTADGVLLVAAVRVDGQRTTGGFEVGRTPLRYGTEPHLESTNYRLKGRVVSVGNQTTVETRQLAATMEANVSTAVADAVTAGDERRIAGETVATVESVETVERGDGWRVVRVDLSLLTRPTAEGFTYGGRAVRIGTHLDFETMRYRFRGRVVMTEP